MSAIGLTMSQVLEDMAHDINPDAQIDVFSEGVTASNVDAFLEGVDLYLEIRATS